MTDDYKIAENEVETFTGHFVNTKDPRPETIVLEDVAHSLSNICRYGGHCNTFYSVAEHAVFVSIRLERSGRTPQVQLMGLHHDDSESYLGDIPRPLKPLLGVGYKRLTARMDEAIVEGLELPFDAQSFHHPVIKAADTWALFVEARHLLPSKGRNWAGSPVSAAWELESMPSRIITPDYWRGGLTPAAAEALYLRRHHDLMEAI